MSSAVSFESDSPPATAPSASSVESVLESGLSQVVAGFEILDRTLEIAERTHVHLVGVDREGALVLVLLAPGDGETAPVRALEALDFVERSQEPLLRHLARTEPAAVRLDATRPARIVVVADLFSDRTRRRLNPLAGLGVEAYELRTLRSQGRQSTFLNTVVGPRVANRESVAATSAEPGSGRLAETLRRRLIGLDDRVEMVRSEGGFAYAVEGNPVAFLDLGGAAGPHGRVPEGPVRRLESPASLDDFVAEIVEAYVQRERLAEEPISPFGRGAGSDFHGASTFGATNGVGPGGW